jgi:hypothetical protein
MPFRDRIRLGCGTPPVRQILYRDRHTLRAAARRPQLLHATFRRGAKRREAGLRHRRASRAGRFLAQACGSSTTATGTARAVKVPRRRHRLPTICGTGARLRRQRLGPGRPTGVLSALVVSRRATPGPWAPARHGRFYRWHRPIRSCSSATCGSDVQIGARGSSRQRSSSGVRQDLPWPATAISDPSPALGGGLSSSGGRLLPLPSSTALA